MSAPHLGLLLKYVYTSCSTDQLGTYRISLVCISLWLPVEFLLLALSVHHQTQLCQPFAIYFSNLNFLYSRCSKTVKCRTHTVKKFYVVRITFSSNRLLLSSILDYLGSSSFMISHGLILFPSDLKSTCIFVNNVSLP